MTLKVQQLISEIQGKLAIIRQNKETQQEENQSLTKDLQSLKVTLQEKEKQWMRKEEEWNQSLETVRGDGEQTAPKSTNPAWSAEEIDEMVKEIEFCISQLKK